jgi:hypothetical protein
LSGVYVNAMAFDPDALQFGARSQESVVDRSADTFMGHSFSDDQIELTGVQLTETSKEVRRCFGQIVALAKPSDFAKAGVSSCFPAQQPATLTCLRLKRPGFLD